MPTTYNGIGTHYYGRKNRNVRHGVCRSCGAEGPLESYDTRLWFVVVFIPVIPLGRKRIIDQCSRCSRHWAASRDQWEMAKQLNVSGAMEKYRSQPSPEAALELHGQLLGFHMHEEAEKLRNAVVGQFADSAVLHAGLAGHLEQMGRFTEATPLFERALALRPDLPEARIGVAVRRTAQGYLSEARALLNFLEQPGAGQLYSLGPLEQLATAYQKAGQHEETLKLCERLLAELPSAGQFRPFRKFVAKSEKALGRHDSVLPQRRFSLRSLFNSKSGSYAPWQRWLAYGGVAAVLAAVGMAALNEYKRQHRTVFVVNELGQPAQVSFDGGPAMQVNARTKLQLTEGRHHVAVAGAIPEEFDIDMSTGYVERWTKDPVWVVNMAGAAALQRGTLQYAANPRPTQYELLLGERFIYSPHVDYAFEEPPRSLNIESNSAVLTKVHLALATEPASALFQHALATADPSGAFRFAETRLQRNPLDAELLYVYMLAAEAAGQTGRAEEFLKSGLWRRPISVPWHRMHQNLSKRADREAVLAREYDAELQKEPANATLLYLRGRVSSEHAEASDYFRRSCQADPAFPWPWLALAFDAANQADWKQSRSLLEKAVELKLEDPALHQLRHLVWLGVGDGVALEAEYRQRLAPEPPNQSSFVLLKLCDVLAVQGKADEVWQAIATWESRLSAAARSAGGSESIRQAARYMLGDFVAFQQAEGAATRELPPEFRLHVLLMTGRVAEAVRDPALAETFKDPWDALAVSLAFHLAGDANEAKTWRDRACAELDHQDADANRAAALLRSSAAVPQKQLDEIVLHPVHKALFVAAVAVGRANPNEQAELAALARRLNVSRLPPYHLVQKATGGGQ